MKLYTSYLLILAALFYQSIHPMQQPEAGEYVNKDLVVKNDYIDQIKVEYTRDDKPDTVLDLRLVPGEESVIIPNVNTIKTLKFSSYGKVKGLLTFADSTDYRIKFRSQVWQKTSFPAVLRITVAGSGIDKKTEDVAPIQSSLTQPVEWKGWGAAAWGLGASAWEKTAAAAAYMSQQAKEQITPRISSFIVTAEIEEKKDEKPLSEPFQGKTFLNKPLAELFLAAKARIQTYGYFLGRDILNLTTDYKVVEANELKTLVKAKWLKWQEIYDQDPQALATIADVLKLIDEAGDNPDKIFSKELLGC